MWRRIRFSISSHNRWALLIFITAAIVGFITYLEVLSPGDLAQQKRVGEAFQPFALGLGALLSGAAGLVYLEGWLSRQKTSDKLAINWVKRFPINRLNKDFRVIENDAQRGVLYIHDLKNRARHWIVNPGTLRALSLSYADVVTVPDTKFRKIRRGDNIKIVD